MREYKKTFLTIVIVRIDFVNSVEMLKKNLPIDIREVAKTIFPIVEPESKTISEFKLTKDSTKRIDEDITEWVFNDIHRNKKLLINHECMYIEYKKYESYEVLKRDFEVIGNKLCSFFPEIQISRIGLRYINQINAPGTDPFNWSGYINSNLLGIFNFGDKDRYSRVFCNYALNSENDTVNVNFGMHNPDFPAIIRKKTFILDYDAYSQGLLEWNELKDKIDIFHLLIEKSFEEHITDDLRRIMDEG